MAGFRAKGDRFAPALPPLVLPHDTQIGFGVGAILIEADGTILESLWDGRTALIPASWPTGMRPNARVLGKRHGLSR